MERRRAMTVSTTISSTRVKPRVFISPILVGHAVQSAVGAARIDVEHVVALLRGAGRALVAAQAPFGFAHRIARHAAQEIDGLAGLLVGHALGEDGKGRRIARLVGEALDLPLVGGALVVVDRLADLAQRAAQVLLLVPLHRDFRERHGDRGKEGKDRHHDQQLDESKSLHCCFGCGPAAGGSAGTACGVCDGTGAGCGWLCTGAGCSGGRAMPAPPTSASVPELNCSMRADGRSMLRTTRGVMSSTISVLVTLSSVLLNRRPSSGSLDMPGTWAALRRSSSLIRPARICVSPSRSRSVVAVLRVPTV